MKLSPSQLLVLVTVLSSTFAAPIAKQNEAEMAPDFNFGPHYKPPKMDAKAAEKKGRAVPSEIRLYPPTKMESKVAKKEGKVTPSEIRLYPPTKMESKVAEQEGKAIPSEILKYSTPNVEAKAAEKASA